MPPKKEPDRKSWEESDERKKALEAIADQEEREAADAWERSQLTKDRLKRAREEYEKAGAPKSKKNKFFGGDD
jgi:hypothetical protein